MKKFLLIGMMLTLSLNPAMAKNVKVQAMSDFSTANPPETWKLRIVEDMNTKDGYQVVSGSVLEGRIENVTPPARLKRNASFVFVPVKFYDNHGKSVQVEKEITGKYSGLSDVSVGSVAKQGAVVAGNKLLDGFFGPGVALVEGAVKNQQGNRAKSAVVSVYESTPLSYANKGKEIEIKKDQIFVMSFKASKEDADDKPNYEYTEEQ